MKEKSILEMVGGEKYLNPHYNIKAEKMTKKELEKEAEEYAYEEWTDYPEKQEIAEEAYLAGAEPREKRIKELEAQVEKMKCCGNCKHYKPVVTVNESISNMCEDYYDGCNNNIYEPYNKWELKEK